MMNLARGKGQDFISRGLTVSYDSCPLVLCFDKLQLFIYKMKRLDSTISQSYNLVIYNYILTLNNPISSQSEHLQAYNYI